MIPVEYVCVPLAIILLIAAIMIRANRRHKTRTRTYRERWSVEEGWEEEK